MNAKAQSNNFLLMTFQVLLSVAITVFMLSTLAAWTINLPVETAAAAPALSPTLTTATDSSSPSPTFIVLVAETNCSIIASAVSPTGAKIDPDRQRCPLQPKKLVINEGMPISMSASGVIPTMFLAPPKDWTRFPVAPQRS